jgi:hypothetical protein
VCSFHETGEFGGRKKGDVARSPPPNDHGFLLVHHLIENAGQILTEAGVRGFTRHEAPNWYCTAFLYGSGDQGVRFQDRSAHFPLIEPQRECRGRGPTPLCPAARTERGIDRSAPIESSGSVLTASTFPCSNLGNKTVSRSRCRMCSQT